MQKKPFSRRRLHEAGQTIVFVAISLVSLLAMAALAIDIVTLYVARTEIQRTADAAALAGAKAIADSGFTTLPPTASNYLAVQTLAQGMAAPSISAMIGAPINQVAGGPAALVSPPAFDFTTHPGSYQVTVNLKRNNLPTFFSKIWARTAASVTATATAEAYNPANLANITPIAPKSVKPWLVANADPIGGVPFVNLATAAVDYGVIGKTFDLVSDCGSSAPNLCSPVETPRVPATSSSAHPKVEYVPAVVTTPGVPNRNVCPSCAGTTDYEQSIECADVTTSYQVLSCGGGAVHVQWDNGINPGPAGNNATTLGGECLIHASNTGLGQNQDLLQDPGPWPAAPFQFKAQSGPQSGSLVTTSNSIVTIPIFEPSLGFDPTGGDVTVVGFLQAFINQIDANPVLGTDPPPGSINITVLNIAGCSSTNNGANPVVGGSGSSPIPVRLITPP